MYVHVYRQKSFLASLAVVLAWFCTEKVEELRLFDVIVLVI